MYSLCGRLSRKKGDTSHSSKSEFCHNFRTLSCTDLILGTPHKGIGTSNCRKFCDKASSYSLCVGLSRKKADTSNRLKIKFFHNSRKISCTDFIFGTPHKGIGTSNCRKFCDKASSYSLFVGLLRKEGDTSNR